MKSDWSSKTPDGKLRGVLPDVIEDDKIVLIKGCSYLRCTYEIRLCTYLAQKENRKLWICCYPSCVFSPALEEYVSRNSASIHVDHSTVSP